MSKSIELLKKRYLANIKEKPEFFIGIELEFPIVNKLGGATDIRVTKALLRRLADDAGFEVEHRDRDGQPIQLKSLTSEDRLLFEVSYNTLEFAFEKSRTIQEVDERFQQYLKLIQGILAPDQHEIQGWGVHPYWQENDNSPVKYPRYEMLMDYLALSQELDLKELHAFPQYGAFICGNQVQLDVSTSNYLQVINVFNQLEAAKAYLFANSEFWGQNWDTRISRDIFWEDSMHGLLAENVGVNPRDFQNETDFFNYLDRSAIFTAVREGQTYYFSPIAAKAYLDHDPIEAYDIDGDKKIIQPDPVDFSNHRSYQYQDLTTRGTVEFRSTCTQPLDQTFAPTAFHVGILANLDQVAGFLKDCAFFKEEGRDYKELRRRFSRKKLSRQEKDHIRDFSASLLQLAKAGLERRGKGEEVYLAHLLDSKQGGQL